MTHDSAECKSKMTVDTTSPERPAPSLEEARAIAAPLFARLGELRIETQTEWHEPVFTVGESEALYRRIEGAHTKNLFVKDKKGRLFLLVCAKDTGVDLKGVHRLVGGQGRVSFAGADAMAAHLGVTPGSVTVFCAMNDRDRAVTIVLDAALLAHARINAHPLTNRATTSIARQDLLTFIEAGGHRPLVVDFGAAPENP